MQQDRWRMLRVLAIAALLGFAFMSTASAQDDEESFDFSQLDGIQEGVSRLYTADMTAMTQSIASPATDGDVSFPTGVYYLTSAIFRFDSDDNADTGLDEIYGAIKEQALSGTAEDGQPVELNETEIDGFGDRAFSISNSLDTDNATEYIGGLFFRDGEYVYFLVAGSTDVDPADTLRGIGETMLENDPGDGTATFSDAGTSTGGIWDLFPANDDASLTGLVVSGDAQIYPTMATPEP